MTACTNFRQTFGRKKSYPKTSNRCMYSETVERDVKNAGWREASSAVASLLDTEGNILQIGIFVHFPGAGKISLRRKLVTKCFTG